MSNKAPTTQELSKLSPRMKRYYENSEFFITIYKAFPYIEAILMENQRNCVSAANAETIGHTLLAMNRDLKILELFALKGEDVAKESEKQNQNRK